VALAIAAVWLGLAPPRAWSNLLKQVEPTAAMGEQLVGDYDCRSCHRIAGEGSLQAPNLAGVTRRSDDPALSELRRWLAAPQAIRRNTAMSNLHLSDSEIEAIVAYLQQIDGAQP
jgi:nitric oxide reductase subunit C